MAITQSIYGTDLIGSHVQKARDLVSKGLNFYAKTRDMVYHTKLGTGYTFRITQAKQKFSLVVYCVYRLYLGQFMAQSQLEYSFGKRRRISID